MIEALKQQDFQFSYELRVRWSEVDMQKVVFNANYLSYFDIAMTEFLRATSITDPVTQALQGKELFARKATIEFHASAHFDDFLQLCVRTQHIGRSSFTTQLAIFREEQRLISGEMIYVYVDTSLTKSTPLPDSWKQGLMAFK